MICQALVRCLVILSIFPFWVEGMSPRYLEIGGLGRLDKDEVRMALEGGRGLEQVDWEPKDAKENGVKGVHCIVDEGIHLGRWIWGASLMALLKAREDKSQCDSGSWQYSTVGTPLDSVNTL